MFNSGKNSYFGLAAGKGFNNTIRLYLRACFPTARSPTARLVRQPLWRDVTFLGLQC